MKKANRNKMFKRIFLVLTVIGILFIHFYAPKFIVEIKNPILRLIRGDHLITTSPSFANNQLKGKNLIFKSSDDFKLSSYLTYASSDTIKGTIILLHGIRSRKEHFMQLCSKLSSLGYNSVALDLRAHGNSNGQYCTFGVRERRDVSKLIDVLSKEEGINENIGIWGQSLGGAIALQALGTDERIEFGIVESTFSDFKTIANDYFKYNLGFNIRPFTNYLIARAGAIAAFDIDDANPNKYCKEIEQPILLVHGTKDRRIKIKYAQDNFMNIASEQKEFLEIQSANHLNVWEKGGDEYFEKVFSFITKNTVGVN